MNIPKDKVIELIRDRGDQDQAQQAERELPDQVDTDQDADLLQRFGINPQELLSKIGGDIPGLSGSRGCPRSAAGGSRGGRASRAPRRSSS